MSRTAFKRLIGEFDKHLGLPSITSDEGHVALTFDGIELYLEFDEERGEIVIFTPMGEVVPDRATYIYRILLGANLFWHGSRGATFGADLGAGRIVMSDREPVSGLSLAHLNNWIEIFLDTAEYWQKWLATANEGGPVPDPLAFDDLPNHPEDVKPRKSDFRVSKA